MNSGRKYSSNHLPLYIQPENFADHLSFEQNYALFLDIDGTLADFTLNPKDSFIPLTTLTLLQNLQDCRVKIAVVTGRSLLEARQMLSPLSLPIAATHGLEIAVDTSINNPVLDNNYTNELAAIKQTIIQACTPYPDFTIEDKPYSVALHYRQNPALADLAYSIVAKTVANHNDWTLKQGKYVWEIVPNGADKGTAILALLAKMQTDHTLYPIFIGDDITDEVGFVAVQAENELDENISIETSHKPIKGMGIKVGNEPTCAHFYVNNIDEVTVLLKSFLVFCQKRATLASNVTDNAPIKKPARRVL